MSARIIFSTAIIQSCVSSSLRACVRVCGCVCVCVMDGPVIPADQYDKAFEWSRCTKAMSGCFSPRTEAPGSVWLGNIYITDTACKQNNTHRGTGSNQRHINGCISLILTSRRSLSYYIIISRENNSTVYLLGS